eukprot:2619881-Amphidinium_carterae.3
MPAHCQGKGIFGTMVKSAKRWTSSSPLSGILPAFPRGPDGKSDDAPHIKIIDFGAATTQRMMSDGAAGKPSYQAPEMFESE